VKDSGRVVVGFGFDWRIPQFNEGFRLAQKIINECSPDAPCEIVGHSQGGLIARLAYWQLKQQGKDSYVRRIITVGTPHYGLYNPVFLWAGRNDLPWYISLASYAGPKRLGVDWSGSLSQREIMAIAATWPAFYELLPTLDGGDSDKDPRRPLIYMKNWYPYPDDMHFGDFVDLRESYRQKMASGDSVPLGRKMATIAGIGQFTNVRLKLSNSLSNPVYEWDRNSEGDGSVTMKSALLDSAEKHTFIGEHVTLLAETVKFGLIAKLVTADISEPTYGVTTPVPEKNTVPYQAVGWPGFQSIPSDLPPTTIPAISTAGDRTAIPPGRHDCKV
jgi:hypothetical protein